MAASSAALITPERDELFSTSHADGGEYVLLVEDNDTVAGLFVQILARESRQVLRVKNGAECIHTFMRHSASIRLVILDCKLPDSDGTGLFRVLRRCVPGLPVLLTSGRECGIEKTLDDGITDFLAKPFRISEVEQKVAALLNRSPGRM
ncbi:MAG: response regulator [Verrucomicrobiota bacterium]